jgi:hypothetical protein
MTVGAGVAVVVIAGLTAALRIDLWGEHGSGLAPPFTYDLEKFQKTDPALIGYRETGRIALKMIEPRGVAVGPEDKIYVAGDRLVHVFTPAGQRLQAIALEAGPRALAVGGPHHKSPGRIYVAMKSHVEVYDPQGHREASWESPREDAQLTSIAVAESDVYVADARGRIVLRYSPEGKLLGSIGARDDLRHIPGFVIPSPYFDVAVAPDGLLRVTNPGGHRIEAYTPGGDLGRGLVCDPGILRLLQPGEYRDPARRQRSYGREGHTAGEGLFGRGEIRVRGGRAGGAAAEPGGQ